MIGMPGKSYPLMSNHSLEMDQTPSSVKAAQVLFFILGTIWIVFGAASLIRMANSGTNPTITLWVIAVLMFGNAGALIFVGWGIGKRLKLFFYLGILVLAANTFLTVTDEFGVFDLITLILDLALLVLLIVTRSGYLSTNRD